MTEYHVRYGGPGVMVYWHVERRSVCIYSQLKSCSALEVAAMLEGVLHHLSQTSLRGGRPVGPFGCNLAGARGQPGVSANTPGPLSLRTRSPPALAPPQRPRELDGAGGDRRASTRTSGKPIRSRDANAARDEQFGQLALINVVAFSDPSRAPAVFRKRNDDRVPQEEPPADADAPPGHDLGRCPVKVVR